ncbi:TetR/AcrR family transcriptional regulator [Pyxidicoccus parkwayensis]|uniref:TetR/AcrR family transcriptional regulator n=1 Tax=Pyxidicoccus parkwayensis TaxID=2813578 RepID=A0ABX7NVZ0_9BACT|nr:TetR/AcrR family transcriptional regulator [Pyxidicoccus parkwaysis]QSQ22633.1 TetR/AcrR family transcriptional regulator [Pyxidicoccus parkwaysis]
MTARGKKSAPKARRTYHHGDLRQALVNATLELIAREDAGAVSLREVARQAGVSAAAPYHHFRDKNALLAAVAEEGFRALNGRMDEEFARGQGAGPTEVLRLLARCYVRFAIEHPAHYRVMFREEWNDEEKYPSTHAEGMRAFQRLLEWAGAVRVAQGASNDAEILALTTWSWVHGLASLWNEGPLRKKTGADSIEPLLERSLDLFMQLVSAAPAPKRAPRGG